MKDSITRCLFLTLLIGVLGTLCVQGQELSRYNILISFPKGKSLSGICIIRTDSAGGAMSIINEFGIKAFDATYQAAKDKVKLHNVISPLNKWYIRRTISKDMAYLFNPHKRESRRRKLKLKEDGSMILINNRSKTTYKLQPIKDVIE